LLRRCPRQWQYRPIEKTGIACSKADVAIVFYSDLSGFGRSLTHGNCSCLFFKKRLKVIVKKIAGNGKEGAEKEKAA
jgi:hypothetical protein